LPFVFCGPLLHTPFQAYRMFSGFTRTQYAALLLFIFISSFMLSPRGFPSLHA
jgi:hypothetical protein